VKETSTRISKKHRVSLVAVYLKSNIKMVVRIYTGSNIYITYNTGRDKSAGKGLTQTFLL
jgi:hypothetical protein